MGTGLGARAVGAVLLVALTGAAPPPRLTAEASLDRFVDVCARGQGRFSPKEIRAIGYGDLPDPVRDYYRKIEGGKFFKLDAEHETFLLDFVPVVRRGDEYRHVCAMVVRDLPFAVALKEIAKRFGITLPARLPKPSYGIEFFVPTQDFQLKVRDIQGRTNTGVALGVPQMLIQLSPYGTAGDEGPRRR